MEASSSTEDPKPKGSLKTAVSVLIATATVFGAFVGWRVSIASGAAGAADSRGLEAALYAANTGSSVSTYLASNLSFFAEYQEHLERAAGLERALDAESDAARRQALADEALYERSLAAASRAYVNVDYLAVDPETGTEYFDGNRFWNAQWAEAAVTRPIDPAPSFADADQARQKTRGLMGVTVGISFALLLLAVATVTPRRTAQSLAAVAVPTLVAACAAVVWLEWFL